MALTQDELDQVYNHVMGKGQSLAGLPDGGNDLSSMYLAPLLKYSPGGVATLVRLAVSLLKGDSAYQVWVNEPGNAGKTLSDFFAFIKGAKGDPFTFGDFTPEQLVDLALTYDKLTPEQKEEMKLKFSDLTEADILALQKPATDAAEAVKKQMVQISEDANAAIKAATDAAESAQSAADNVQDGVDGKTPVLESVNAQSGDIPSGSFSGNGVDASGNPKYILNLTLPAGKDGQPAVFEQGTTTTLEPTEEARVEVVENGETEQGNPKYILNFFIPRGPVGNPGTGSGNVSVDGAGLVSGKKYLFVPNVNDSTTGAFVEYVVPEIPQQVQPDWNATEGKGAILHKPTIPTKTSQLTNDNDFTTDSQTVAQISVHNQNGASHADIRQKISDVEAIARGKSRAKVFDTVSELDTWLAVASNIATLEIGDNFYIKATDVSDYWWDGTAKQPIEAEKVDLTEYVKKEAGKGLFSGNYNDLSNKPAIPTVPGVATPSADGVMSSGDKAKVDRLRNYTTATTVANLNIGYEVIYVTLNANASLSVNNISTTLNGWTITAYVYCSSARTIAIPTSGSYVSMCGSSYTCPAGKWVEFNLTCVDGKWHIAKLEQQ